MSLTFEQQLADVPKQTTDYPQILLDDRTLQRMLCNESKKINTTGIETGYILQTPLQDYIVFEYANFSATWNAAYFRKNSSIWYNVVAPNASFLMQRGAIPVADLGRMPIVDSTFDIRDDIKDRLFFSSAAQIAVQNIIEQYGGRGFYTTRFLSRNVSNLTCALPTPTTTPLSTPLLLPGTTPYVGIPTEKSGPDAGLILGLSVAGIVLLLGLVFGYYYFFMRRSRRRSPDGLIFYRPVNQN